MTKVKPILAYPFIDTASAGLVSEQSKAYPFLEVASPPADDETSLLYLQYLGRIYLMHHAYATASEEICSNGKTQEERDWNYCLATYNDGLLSYEEMAACFLGYIEKYPNSKNVADAYFSLARFSFKAGDLAGAVTYFEKIFDEYPEHYIGDRIFTMGLNGYNAYFKLCKLMGKEEEAFAYSEKISDFHEDAEVKFFQAQYYESHGETGKAGDLDQLYDKLDRALYLLYWEGRYSEAEEMLLALGDEAMEISETMGFSVDDLTQEIAELLAVVELRDKIRFSEDALELFNDSEERERLIELFHLDFTKYSLSGEPSNELFLLYCLLYASYDVEEVQILCKKKTAESGDAKDPQLSYSLAYKTLSGWHIIESKDLANLDQEVCSASFDARDLQFLIRDYSAVQRADVFPVSDEFYFTGDFPFYFRYSYILNQASNEDFGGKLRKERSETLLKLGGDSAKNKVINLRPNNLRLNEVATAVALLPETHMAGLNSFVIEYNGNAVKRGRAGWYDVGEKQVKWAWEIWDRDLLLPVHELVHYWDFSTVGSDGKNLSPGDLSLIFYRISWDAWSPIYIAWHKRNGATVEDFSNSYGETNGKEDLATSAVDYFMGTNERMKVRKQMLEGHFERAAKYLFNKYIRSFDPEDGLCFEYNITEEDPPLSMAEVEKALQFWLEENPGTVAQSTIDAIREIKREYEGFKADPDSYYRRLGIEG